MHSVREPVDTVHIRTDADSQRLKHHTKVRYLFSAIKGTNISISIQTLIVLVNRDDVLIKVNILRDQSEKCTNPKSGVIYNFEHHKIAHLPIVTYVQ